MHITSNPLENYGFITWEADNENVAYYRLEIQELDWESGDTIVDIVERSEIWDKCFAKIADAYLREPEPYRQFRFQLEGFDSSHNPIPTLKTYGDGEPATKGCFWECESSNFAYRIQQYDAPQGGWNYRFAEAYETENEDLSVRIPYFRWFSPAQFDTHTPLVNQVTANWHNYNGWDSFRGFINYYNGGIASTTLPHYQLVQQNMGLPPGYFDNEGYPIASPEVRGIKKGWGQWYAFFVGSSVQINGVGVDWCETTPDLTFMRQFMTDGLNIVPALTCPPNLGGGNSSGGGIGDNPPVPPGGFNLLGYWRGEFVQKPKPGDGEGDSQDNSLDDEIIFFDGDNWMSRISDVFAHDSHGSTEERFTQVLSQSEFFGLERFDSTRTVLLSGSFDTFFNSDGTPYFPNLSLTQGMYRLTVKKTDCSVFFIVFEVREPFDMQVELKDYFEALLFPNPHTDNNVKANFATTAALKVDYKLFDHMGNVFYTRNFNLPKDHSGEHSLKFDGHLPDGFLYHKFTFEDGSHKTYITVKQQ